MSQLYFFGGILLLSVQKFKKPRMVKEEEPYQRQKQECIVMNQAGLNVDSTHMMARAVINSPVAYQSVDTTKITYILNYRIIIQQ
ncbi:MAG: hypothetical protein ACJ71P_13495 [Nitrososphaeraceae archaeon]